jgi:glycosyltransferase involved in cell wall biosynthesis
MAPSVLFIGAINLSNFPKGGEEYKNQLIFRKMIHVDNRESYIDTYNWKSNPIVSLNLMYKLFFRKWDSILLSTSSISAYRLICLMKFLKPSLLFKLNYLVVGGYFPEGIRKREFKWEQYKALKNIIVQGDILRQQLLSCSELKNLKVVPNFKQFNYSFFDSVNKTNKFMFVFIGRVSKTKGVLEIIEASKILKFNNPLLDFQVDFYGPREEDIDFPENLPIAYKGYLDIMNNQKESYETLSEYSCMLFPTYWMGEGFPGVIIDAFIAGLPVIATDWNMNKEVIDDGETGIIIPIKDAKALAWAMLNMMENREMVSTMSKNSLDKAKDYHIDVVWSKIEKLIF